MYTLHGTVLKRTVRKLMVIEHRVHRAEKPGVETWSSSVHRSLRPRSISSYGRHPLFCSSFAEIVGRQAYFRFRC